MLPAFLITLREVVEATLIVATILGILTKLQQFKSIKTVWLATGVAVITSIALLIGGSLLGLKVQELYTGKTEEAIEGVFMLTSAVFITWAVFWLHKYFARQKVALLQKVKQTVAEDSQKALFILTFTAVFREGIEIVLFLTTIYLSSKPFEVFSGFSAGIVGGLIVSWLFFTATVKMPVYRAFQATTLLLILFAAGLAGRGIHEFSEAGILPEFAKVYLPLLPPAGIVADFVKAIFGLTAKMDNMQLLVYGAYIAFMRWYIYQRKKVLPAL